MIDNLHVLDELCPRHLSDVFHLVKVVRRKKDGWSRTSHVASYRLDSETDVEDLKGLLMGVCAGTVARAMVKPNPRSYADVAFRAHARAVGRLRHGSHRKVMTDPFSVAEGHPEPGLGGRRLWVVDVDEDEGDDAGAIEDGILHVGGTVHGAYPTPGGWHLLTSKFDLGRLQGVMPGMPSDKVKKDGLMLAFAPASIDGA